MKTILVSQRIDFLEDRNEKRDALDQNLVRFLKKCGFLPVPVPNVFNGQNLLNLCDALNPVGFVLSGGNDIGTFPERDRLESAIIELALEKNLPLVGICRGMQFIVKFWGGELCPVQGHVRTLHRLKGAEFFPSVVNSYHNSGVKKLPQVLCSLALAEDGIIEAITHKTFPVLGIMWHPERNDPFNAKDMVLFKNFLEKGNENCDFVRWKGQET